MDQQYMEINKQLWEGRVEYHLKSELYDMESFMAGKTSLTEIEKNALGDVSGKTLLHLQCHFGQDTLSWARKGAIATGIDFSEKAIETAKELAGKLDLKARFITTNVYDLSTVLEEKFDIVFTTFGAIPWLPDLEKWAAIVGNHLKSGGIFYLAEFHPAFYMFNFDNHKVEYSYFNENKPYVEEVEGSYADGNNNIKGTECFWNHSFAEVLNPLLKNGMNLLEFNEYDFSPYKVFPNMEEREPGRYIWGRKFGIRFPHIFSLKMQKR